MKYARFPGGISTCEEKREVLMFLIVFNQEKMSRASDGEWLTEKKINSIREKCLCVFICDGMRNIIKEQRDEHFYDSSVFLFILLKILVIEV